MAADIQKALDLHSQGNLDEAAVIYEEFLSENPKQPDVSNLLGQICMEKQDFERAKSLFKDAVAGFPCAEFYTNLAFAFLKQKQPQSAMECYDKVLEYEPKNLNVVRNIAQTAKRTEQYDYAIKYFMHALKLEPKDVVGWNQLGLLYEKKHEYQKAKECYVKSLKVKENYEALHNMGVLYRFQRNFQESVKCLKQALKLKPNSAITELSLAMSYLSLKDFENGYKYYMTKKPEIAAMYKNHWDGKSHPDDVLLVYFDSGFGDQIMFCRYLNFLKEKFRKVRFYTSAPLKKLFEENFPEVDVTIERDNNYDFSDNVMYLNYHLGMDFDNIPCSNGYLMVQKSEDERFLGASKKIGLFWQGNYDGYENRAIKLKELSPLLELKNCTFYGFVKDDKENQIDEFPQIINIGKDVTDFYDTASKLLNLDVLVTIDTATANLAGALGVKTFLLLPYASEWRWFKDDNTTPWYDSVTIFKQQEHWNWSDVVSRVKEEISKLNA